MIKKTLLALILLPFIVGGVANAAKPTKPGPPVQEPKITICHSRQPNPSNGQGGGPQDNPYGPMAIEVNQSAADGISGNEKGNDVDHYSHNGPLFNNTGQDYWGDIIPPIPGVHTGLNWTTAGQAIYNNDCQYEEMPAVPTYACDALTATKLTDNKFQFDVTKSVSNGATVDSYNYDLGNGFTTGNISDNPYTYEYTTAGNYNVVATVNFDVDGQINPDTCTVSVATGAGGRGDGSSLVPASPGESSPVQVEAPSTAVNAGSGSEITVVAALFGSVASLGYGLVRLTKFGL